MTIPPILHLSIFHGKGRVEVKLSEDGKTWRYATAEELNWLKVIWEKM